MAGKSTKDLITRIILFYFLLITPFAIMGYMYYNYRVEKHILVTEKDQQAGIGLQISKLEELFQHVNSDLLTGANHPGVFNIYSKNKALQQKAIEEMGMYCSNLLVYNKIFSESAFLDLNGQEVLKVKYQRGKPFVATGSELQNKWNEIYVQAISKMPKDGIYVSKLDLYGPIDSLTQKRQPVIHFLTPVFDDHGTKLGYFALNLIGYNLIYGLKVIGDEMGWKNYMINEEGYFILVGNADYEWKFMFGEDSLLKLNDEQRDIYELLTKKKSGIIENSQGIYCYYNINAQELSNGLGNQVQHNDSWLLVSILSNHALQQNLKGLIAVTDWILLVLSGILLMTIAGYLAVSTHKQREIQLQLTRSEAELRLANKTKDKFISILAHDLKNPLASIMGFVDLLKDGYEEMPQKSKNVFITTLENSTHLLQRLIDDVLSWARSTTGSMQVAIEPFLVNKVIENALRFSEMQASKKHVDLIKRYEDKFIGLGDSKMIETILRNILSNAIKFSHPNSPVEIYIYQTRGQIQIDIRDYGIGMEDKKAKDLFKLDQLHSTPGTMNERGTGMGLILCRDFIKRNHGEILVTSKPGEGSTFTVSIPAYQQ